jgi:hypothetical protein
VLKDLYSIFLAGLVKDKFDISQCKKKWSSACQLLEWSMSKLNQTTSGKQRLSSFGLSQRLSSLSEPLRICKNSY